jgi:hypothetical protein
MAVDVLKKLDNFAALADNLHLQLVILPCQAGVCEQ